MAMINDVKIMMLKGEKGDKGDGSYDDTEIRELIAQETADREEEIAEMERNFLNYLYPVGSIYMSVGTTSPAVLFGGTWVQIEGKFLLASSSSHTNGSTGGAESISYTPQGSIGNHTLTTNETPYHHHAISAMKKININEGTSTATGVWGWDDSTASEPTGVQIDEATREAVGGDPHNHTWTGTQATLDKMPPYLSVNVWKRTA